jgi:hypothetical protein
VVAAAVEFRYGGGMRRALLGSLLALSSLACAEKETPISELVAAAIVEGNEQAAIFCDCFAELGFASATECETALGFIGPSQERCVTEAYEINEAASREYLECIRPLQEEYTACINSMLDCSVAGSVDACNNDLDIGVDECIVLPMDVQRDLDLCFE